MKISVSLPDEDVEFLDAFVRQRDLDSRSAALQRAVRLLRVAELGAAYESAWDEWAGAGEAETWDAVLRDGMAD